MTIRILLSKVVGKRKRKIEVGNYIFNIAGKWKTKMEFCGQPRSQGLKSYRPKGMGDPGNEVVPEILKVIPLKLFYYQTFFSNLA